MLLSEKLGEKLAAAFVICLLVLASVLTVLSIPSLVVINRELVKAKAQEPVRIVVVEMEEKPVQCTGYISKPGFLPREVKYVSRKYVPPETVRQFLVIPPGQGSFDAAIYNVEVHVVNVQPRLIFEMKPMGNPDYLWPNDPKDSVKYYPTYIRLETPDPMETLLW